MVHKMFGETIAHNHLRDDDVMSPGYRAVVAGERPQDEAAVRLDGALSIQLPIGRE